MADREKVIRGLEVCKTSPEFKEECAGCPYDDGQEDCIARMAADALEMLKAQEPRVMTLEEVKQAESRDVWLELSGNIAEDVLTATTIYGCGAGGICTRYESLNYSRYCVKPYGWRCWSSRPTEEQRKAVKWDADT